MLIEFSVSNFRSFREKQTLSMVAAPRLKKRENVFKLDVKGEKLPDLLKIAAIYGPNASGKSNLMKALGVVVDIARRKPSAQTIPLPVVPFRFDPNLLNQPSYFEFHFVEEGQRFEFKLSATPERIVHERLAVFPKGKECLLYERQHSISGDEYEFGSQLEGGEILHETWRKLTGPQVLFIAQAVANSSEELKQLRMPFRWLESGIVTISDDMSGLAKAAQNLAKNNSIFAKEISSFLQEVDVPVTNIRFEPEVDLTERSTAENLSLENNPAQSVGLINATSRSKMTLTHKTALGEAQFELLDESEGTKRLIGFWLPWSFIDRLNSGLYSILAVDELDSSLHPDIVASLVAKLLKFDRPAQLIFTTHDTHLMDTKLLRRDQFWLTERDVNGATQMRSIHDFDGRESEDIEKRYYEGRYRGLPFLRKT